MLRRSLTVSGENFLIRSAELASGTSFDLPFDPDNANSMVFLAVARTCVAEDPTFILPVGWTILVQRLTDDEKGLVIVYQRIGATAITGPGGTPATANFQSRDDGSAENVKFVGVSWVVKNIHPTLDPIATLTESSDDGLFPAITPTFSRGYIFTALAGDRSTPLTPTYSTTTPQQFTFYDSNSSLVQLIVGKASSLVDTDYSARPSLGSGYNESITSQILIPTINSEQLILSEASSTIITPQDSYGTTGSLTVTSTGTFTLTCAAGLEISTDGGSTFSSSASVSNNDTIILRALNTDLSNTTRNLTTIIGGATTTIYSLTIDSRAKATGVPGSIVNQGLSSVVTSDSFTITNLSTTETVTLGGTGSSILFSKNGGSFVASGTVVNNDSIRLRMTTSDTVSTTRTATFRIGGVTVGTFSATTYNEFNLFEASSTPSPTATTVNYTIPAGVTTISIACIGGGQEGGAGTVDPGGACAGGGGGGFSASNGITVSGGQVLVIKMPAPNDDNLQYPATEVSRQANNQILCKANSAPPLFDNTIPGGGASTTGAVGTLVTRMGGAGGTPSGSGVTRRGGGGGGSGEPVQTSADVGVTASLSEDGGPAGTRLDVTSTAFTVVAGQTSTSVFGASGEDYGAGGGGSVASTSAGTLASAPGRGSRGAVVILVGGRTFSTATLSF